MLSLAGPRAALVAGALVVLVATAAPTPVLAAPEDDVEAAQRRANRAAAEMAEAEEQLARASDAVARVETRVARIDARTAAVRDQVRQLAIRLYVEGNSPLARLLRIGDAGKVVQAQQYSRVVTDLSTDSLRQYRAEREDLRDELAALEREKGTRSGAFDDLRRRRTDAARELDRLTRAVAQARAAQEQDRRAQARATVPPVAARPGQPAARAAPPAPAAPRPPAASAAPAGGSPVASAGWVCPVQGPHAFSNDYGAPRGGGRSHQGNDILAARGTPVVANVSGTVTHRTGAVSGKAYYLAGDDGNRYFGAHLDTFGASGRVSAGTQVGTVGNTGDAAGGPPHLHFEIHPGGSGNVNPFPTLSRYC
jgi:murein DD-endopeptidase MepM/ murein hydrolase activator NlpD